MRGVGLCVLLALLLAGCTNAADVTDDGVRQDDGSERRVDRVPAIDWDGGLPVPVWSVGDWWAYEIAYSSGESFSAKIIVHAEDGGSYHLTADDRDLILRAAITHYPNLGPVRKSDLAQSIHGDLVEFMRFPMKNATWTAPYREASAEWSTVFDNLTTGKGLVPGFTTTMRHSDDGLVRLTFGYSPLTKWYTDLTFDFDGVPPADVTYTLRDWGSNHTGTFPLLEILEGVHRLFPTQNIAQPSADGPPPTPATEPAPTATFEVEAEGSSILRALFAGAGGPGTFEFTIGHGETGATHSFPWRPNAAGGHFDWGVIPNAPAGEWGVTGYGVAQNFAFLFLETYEVRETQGKLPAD